jgi:hypothetical protein
VSGLPYGIRRWFNGDALAARRYRKNAGRRGLTQGQADRSIRLSQGAPVINLHVSGLSAREACEGAAAAAATVAKVAYTVPVSRQYALDYGLVEPTPEEQRERDAWRAAYDEKRAAATAAWPVFVTALAAVTDPVARAVLDLHAAGDGRCSGCDFDGYEAERPAWPCRTTCTVAAVAGVAVPPDLWMAEQAWP